MEKKGGNMDTIINFVKTYGQWLQLPEVSIIDLVEIVIIAFAIYQIIIWIKKTRAWSLLKGLIVLLAISLVAVLFHMNVILWIFELTSLTVSLFNIKSASSSMITTI